jgi:dipeptidyl aminopeptidase/acylaminoacyl peptidase
VGSFAAASAQTAPAQPSVQAFAVPKNLTEPVLSPDGKHLATVEVHGDKSIAVIHTLDPAGTPAIGIPVDTGFIVGVYWIKNDRLMVTVNVNRRYMGDDVKPWFRSFLVDPTGNNRHQFGVSSIDDLALDDPDHVYATNGDRHQDEWRSTMFRVSLKDDTTEQIAVGGHQTKKWIMDGHGKVIARLDWSTNPPAEQLLVYNNGDWKEVQSSSTVDNGLGFVGLSRDGKSFVQRTRSTTDPDLARLVTRDIASGKETPLFSDPKYDVGAALIDPWDWRVLGAAVVADQQTDHYFDEDMQALQRGLVAAFPGKAVHAVSWDMAKKKVVLLVESPKFPPTYFLLDRVTHTASPIAATYDALEENQLGEMKPYPYKARDGLDIPAYITLPPGKAAKNLPVVVMPHGGPRIRDQIGFDWMAQFLANRGYAVLQPNFRGSSGYGKKFIKAGYGEWGGKMQDDVTDGVKKLIADGIADPKRICIVGWSYGGYAALAGAAFTPDLYACAVGGAGVYDLNKLRKTLVKDTGRESTAVASWPLFMGDPDNDGDILRAKSPVFHADQIKIPVLLVHGKDDYTVRIDQTQAMDAALRKAGKKVTTIIIPDESHYLQKMETRSLWLTELEKFLKENIGN